MRTTWLGLAEKSANVASEPRPHTSGSPRVGPSEAGECLRMPQRRNGNEDSVAGPSPPARLFVSRSSADAQKITRPHEKGIQPHPWFGEAMIDIALGAGVFE